jgi:hypothetical protein
LFVLASQAIAQDSIKIGRSQLALADAKQWQIAEVSGQGVKYSGDIAGTIPMETKRLVFQNAEALTKAVFVTSMTIGGVSAQMTYTNYCPTFKPSETIFVKDSGGVNRLNCLAVIRVPNLIRFISAVPSIKPLFENTIPHTQGGYYIHFAQGLDNGAQTRSYALLAQDLKGLEEGSVENNSKIPDAVIRWALAFAKENGSALTSFSGNWSIPAMNFNH